MLIRNNSARPHHIDGKMIAPLEVVEVADSWKPALKSLIDNFEIEEVKKAPETKKADEK